MLELLPGEGVGPLRFGMSPSEAQGAFTEPPVYEEWMGGNLNDSILFRGLVAGFDRHDSAGPLANSRLIEFRVRGREDIVLAGRAVLDSRRALAPLCREGWGFQQAR